MNTWLKLWGAVALLLGGCNPAGGLNTPEYATFLEGLEGWQQSDAVSIFNQLDENREQFPCKGEVDRAKRAAWREQAGPVKLEQTPEGKALQGCYDRFRGSIALKEGPLAGAVLQHWVNHNIVPEVQKALDAEVTAEQGRIGEKGCGGDECSRALTVVGDLIVPRIGHEVSVAWGDAGSLVCARTGFGGLGPWRLPTRDELVAIRESGKVASDLDLATYWSSTREFDEDGRLQAYVLRFDVESLGTKQEPKLVPFDRDGVPSVAKVRCVFDLAKAETPTDAGSQMEQTLMKAGCKRGWEEYVRLREDLIVSWKVLSARGKRGLSKACKELTWCGLSWRVPSGAEAKRLAEDPWFRDSAEGRCVASAPAKAP
jgi:hypothetical protein